jgi:hypothetical protein
VCGAEKIAVTEPRDYGHLEGEWRAAIIKKKEEKSNAGL